MLRTTIILKAESGQGLTEAELAQALAIAERTLTNHGFVVMGGDLPRGFVTYGHARGNVFYLVGGPVPRDLTKGGAWLRVKADSVVVEFSALESAGSL